MRLQGLDIFRGLAIVLMVTFHFCFDLRNFGYVDFDLKHGDFWKYFRYLIVSMFIFLDCISTHLAHQNGVNIKKLKKRIFFLSIASLIVSIGSYTQFPNSWIYFGILHFFLVSSLLGLLFYKTPKISLLLGIFIIIGFNMSWINMHWLYNMFSAFINQPRVYTQELVSLVPWFGVYLLGLAFGSNKLQEVFLSNKLLDKKTKINTSLSFLGKHSLLIYLSHQLVLFSLFYIIGFIFPL